MSARDTESESARARGREPCNNREWHVLNVATSRPVDHGDLNRLLARSQTARPLRRRRGEGMRSKPATSPSGARSQTGHPSPPFDKQRFKPATCAANQAQTGSHRSPAQLTCAPSECVPCALGLGSRRGCTPRAYWLAPFRMWVARKAMMTITTMMLTATLIL